VNDPDYNPAVPAHVPPELVYDFNVRDYQSQDPFISAHALLNSGLPEIFWTRNLGGHWIVACADAIAEAGRNTSEFSTQRMFVPDHQNPDPPFFLPNQTDPPLHAPQRAVIAPLFAPARIEMLQGKIRAMSIEKIEAIAQGTECEFIEDYAAEFPVIVFLNMTDLPTADRFKLRDIAHRILDPSGDVNRSAPVQDLVDYLTPIIEDRIASPRDDVLSTVLSEGIRGKGLTRDIAVMLAATVVMAGLDTVTGALTYFARHLAENRADRLRLIEQPEVIPRAIEEILRRYGLPNVGRQVKDDTVFRGVKMRKNDHVMWGERLSNLDERAFPNALAVDFDRKRAPHSTFGNGIHFCPGATLARAELRIFAETWLRRFPEFHLKPGTEVSYRDGHNVMLRELHLVLGPSN
jgi:cytochrome P450